MQAILDSLSNPRRGIAEAVRLLNAIQAVRQVDVTVARLGHESVNSSP